MDMEMVDENWTPQTWYAIAMKLEEAAMASDLPRRLRKQLQRRAEACWQTGDWLRGITAQDWDKECAKYRAEDELMERGYAATITEKKTVKNGTRQIELELA